MITYRHPKPFTLITPRPMPTRMSKHLIIVLLSLVIGGCSSSTKPKFEAIEPLPRGSETPIFITAARQKEAIKQALRNVGFNIVDHLEDSERMIRVTIGAEQGSRACGTLHNVRFQLRIESHDVAEVRGQGWTGTCQPNILDELSRTLWQKLVWPQSN